MSTARNLRAIAARLNAIADAIQRPLAQRAPGQPPKLSECPKCGKLLTVTQRRKSCKKFHANFVDMGADS